MAPTVADRPIGVFDTGVGGFSVVLEMQRVLPHERIVYFGDTAHMPYGSRSADDILHMTRQICAYMEQRGVKAAAAACNTISTVIDRCRSRFHFPLFSIIEAGVSAACPHLSALIEAGKTSAEDVDGEIRTAVDDILRRAAVKRLILACTHYPLVRDRIAGLYPDLELIDPARRQALDVRDYLAEHGLLRDGEGSVELNTSGNPEQYRQTASRVGIASVMSVNRVCPVRPLEEDVGAPRRP